MPAYSEEFLEEVSQIININRKTVRKKTVNVIFDGRQYTIKVPKSLADAARLSHGDEFEFCVEIEGKERALTGRLKDAQE